MPSFSDLPRSGEAPGTWTATSPVQVDSACDCAASAFLSWQSSDGAERASLLCALASALEAERTALIRLADVETALGEVRLNGELDRTAFQLRRFADIARRGDPYAVIHAPAVPGPPPEGHPAMQRWNLPLGPVAMFSASNFPFAFSVLGGDTAAALAAGCSVVVKAHPGHPLLSQRVFDLATRTIDAVHAPTGLLGLVQEQGHEMGLRLLRHPAIAAGAFTGSVSGGAALAAAAASRPRPIPFFGELGSINPVVALPQQLATQGHELGQALASSITAGCGQFCTSPGVLILIDDLPQIPDAAALNDAFVFQLADALRQRPMTTMLNDGIRRSLDKGVGCWAEAGAHMLLDGRGAPPAPLCSTLAQVSAKDFVGNAVLRNEVFGPACLIVRAADPAQAIQALTTIGGSLTVTLWGSDEDCELSRALVRAAMAIAGRVLFSGVPTGVAVTRAQQHGGPWPSGTRPESTSVGDFALTRFLRPVCLQSPPDWLTQRAGRVI